MQDDGHARFAASVLPHLDAAYNLARWLVRDAHDAQDVVQDALVRALRHFDGFRGGDPRPWLLAIVRNAAFAWLGARRPGEVEVPDDELDAALAVGAPPSDPESLAIRRAERREIDAAIAALPIAFREARGAARARGAVVPRHRAHHRRADRHRDVAPVARAATCWPPRCGRSRH